jgi:FlaA1/EpsC-like NDP-sugar epimerase
MMRLSFPPRLRSEVTVIIHDLIMVLAAWLLAHWLRFNLDPIFTTITPEGVHALLILVPIQLAAFLASGLYRGVWRFASLPDIFRILGAVLSGTAVAMTALFLLTRGVGIPRSIPAIYAMLLILLLSGPRLLYRWYKDRGLEGGTGDRVLIVGAGTAGEMLARDLMRDPRHAYCPVAFVDDNRRRHGRAIQGLPIVAGCDAIPKVAKEFGVDLILLALPSATAREMQRVVEMCEQSDIPFRSVPKLNDLVSGTVRVDELREVCIEDLLGRAPVLLDWPAIAQVLSGKTILVTGAGGSIGSELCRQLAGLVPARLILLESSEFNLYSIEMELRQTCPELEVASCLGDVTDTAYVNYVFERFRPQVVFHAAAYKHVPMLEAQVRQALRNNVLGTRCVATAADAHGCEVFVLVSTDKAVNPANIMGASKRAAELFCQNLNARSRTHYITVRFGNVLDSAGSVIPLFRRQIADGGPVTVTDPRIERYFMTIPEACQLIMQTIVLGRGGEIFVLDMGEPVKIKYLAEQMIRLSGKIPGEDIPISYIGLRPGEKLFEELFHEQERLEPTSHDKVLLARHREVGWEQLNTALDTIAEACERLDDVTLRAQLVSLVPEYRAQPPVTSGDWPNG